MKKLLILALTSAFVAAANAAGDWFRVVVSGSTQTTTGAKWSTTPAAANVADGVISIDEDIDTALELTPDALSPDAQTNTVVTVAATFTAISDVPENLTGATTALTVAKENNVDYYFYWDGDSWEKITTVSPTLNTPVTVRIELDNTSTTGTTATIKVDGTTVATVVKGTKTKVSGLAFAGTGKIGNINADYTKAYASYNGIYYATVGGAIAAKGGNSGDITVYAHNNVYPANIIKDANDVLLFPRTKTDEQNGSTDHPYEIADADDLIALKDAVTDVPAARSLSYKQTADIDMASTGAFAGIGTYAKVPTSGTPFNGTYDGDGKKISNVTRAGGNTQGIFNQVGPSGVIENLVVENMTFGLDVTGEYGCAIVGNAGGGATLRNLTAAGVFGSSSKPSTHNMAGIVVRLSPGATANVATTIDSCTNNATIYGGYTKLGGICAIVQEQDGFKAGKVVFKDCANNGTLVCKRTSEDVTGNAGIVGYTQTNVELNGCYSNGQITNADGANTDKDAALIGWVYAVALTDGGKNSAPKEKKMIAHKSAASFTSNNTSYTCSVTGFQYATVANNVATTIAPPYTLAKGNTYLLEGDVAASETPVFILAAAGDTIAFDTALGYTFAGTVGSSVLGWSAKSAPDGTVTTYSLEQTSTPVDSTAETTLVAVPKGCTAAGLISTDNRDTGDILKVYSKGDKCYYTWTLTGAKGTWDPLQTWVINGEAAATSHSKPASEVELSAGQAAWLTRKSAASKNEKIILAVVAEGNTIPATVQKGYNLVAPPPKAGASTITIDEVVADDATGKDKVFIPAEGKAPYNLDFKDGHWGYDKYTIENGQLKKVRITDVTIPAGTGFFYINNGDAAKSVTLGSED